jgi:hypothetical protein
MIIRQVCANYWIATILRDGAVIATGTGTDEQGAILDAQRNAAELAERSR